MKLWKVDTLQAAREKLLAAASAKPPEREKVSVAHSIGRILAADLGSTEEIPGFRRSTVDGYAVAAADTQGVTESVPVFLDIVEEIRMGTAPVHRLHPGQTAYVPTGGMLPEGADAVVMVEYCEKFTEHSIAVYDALSPGRNVVAAGEDIAAGQVFLTGGTRIRAQEVGALSAAGVDRPEVFRPWRITIISTGDELVDAADVPKPGQVRDVNTYALSAAACQCGFEVVETTVIKDAEAKLQQVVAAAMQTSDVVVVSGGSSQGEKDHTAQVLDRLASPGVFTHGIALKPGKPTILGYDEESGTVLAGLPGHPVAALLTFELLLGWLYRRLTGQRDPETIPAAITENVPAAGGKTTCLPVKLKRCGSGRYTAEPVFGKSGLITSLTKADGYMMMDVNQEGLKAGERVQVTLLR